MQLVAKRKLVNNIALSLSMAAMVFGLIWLGWILFMVVKLGIGGLSLDIFTKMTPPAGVEGGLANAIYGSFVLVGLATLIGSPVGILVGIYLAEFGSTTQLGRTTRYVNDLLLSAPSIAIGLFVSTLFVIPFGGYSAWAGVLALTLILVPVVVRTTENMLALVPNSLREAAFALGAPKYKMILTVSLRAAKSGVVTGLLLGVARIAGETAPLLFTVASNQFWSSNMSKEIANLPVVIARNGMTPYADLQQLAWTAVFLITLGVLILNIVARTFFRQEAQH